MEDATRRRLAQGVYTDLLAANDLIWHIAMLDHPDPLDAARQATEHMDSALKGYTRLHPYVDNRKGE